MEVVGKLTKKLAEDGSWTLHADLRFMKKKNPLEPVGLLDSTILKNTLNTMLSYRKERNIELK